MKKKIAILGSTGSIGKNLIDIIDKDKKNFEIILLSANKNYLELLRQAKKYKVKNLVITNNKSYETLIKKNKKKTFNIYNDFENLNKIFKKKADYIMSAISGIEGLNPTVKIIKHTKKIAIANKEAIICGWNLILKELKKNNTQFIPVDSEHFSIWYGLKNNKDLVNKLILTASGGPFIDLPLNKFKKINLKQALKHPNWKMGKKITIDSATMMNKVLEVIEAKNIFNINYGNIHIVTHPTSYVHSIISFENGLIKIIAHDTDMKIPIFNTLYSYKNKKKIDIKNINFKKLNNLNIKRINFKKFPLVKILKMLPKKNSLYETILVSANDELVNAFLQNKIKFTDISKKLIQFLKKNEFKKYKSITPNKIQQILDLNEYVRFNINTKSI